VEAVELAVEELLVAVAEGGAGHGSDLVVDAFDFTAGYGWLEPVEDAHGMPAQRFSKAFHLADAAFEGALDPAFQVSLHGLAGAPLPYHA
jgi:hypothetical protein